VTVREIQRLVLRSVSAAGITPEEVNYSDNNLCETCKHMGGDGSCLRYRFQVKRTGHCQSGYKKGAKT
jgi:hypothetical protein